VRRIGARVLAFLVVAAASFALWSGLALAGSAATTGSGTDAATDFGTPSRLIQTQETPDTEATPDTDGTRRKNCPRDRNGEDTTETTQTSTDAV
jgi:hypothetical protein